MKITPLDIRQRRFKRSLRGFSVHEVEAFLELVAGEFEELVRENIALKEDQKRAQQRLEQYHEREHTLQETMVTAQRISDDLKAAAKKEAELVLAEAEHQAEKIVQTAHQKLVQVVADINELKRQRIQFESQVRAALDSHAKLLDTFSVAYERTDENVSFLAPKRTGSES